MRTTLDLPEKLLAEAQQIIGAKTKTQVIITALNEFISKRQSRNILKLKGSLKENYSYKTHRKKR